MLLKKLTYFYELDMYESSIYLKQNTISMSIVVETVVQKTTETQSYQCNVTRNIGIINCKIFPVRNAKSGFLNKLPGKRSRAEKENTPPLLQ